MNNATRLRAKMVIAKKLWKTGKYKKWTDAVSAAWKGKNIGAVKIIQRGEKKSTPAKKVLQQNRNKKGTFTGYKVLSGIGDGNMNKVRDLIIQDLKKCIEIRDTAKQQKKKLLHRVYVSKVKKLKEQLRRQNALIGSSLR